MSATAEQSKLLTAGYLTARLDRIPVWSLPGLFVGIIGIGFLFTFYDVFDINVSFIQTCIGIVPGCTPAKAADYIGMPVLLNLVGYVIGTLILSPLSDRYGRRDLLLITMLLTGAGSIWNAAVGSYGAFIGARTLTGIGIGADLAIVNTYINEMAPRAGRARYTGLIFIFSALGAVLGIWLGLILATPATPFPLGIPFAQATPHFEYGWRIMYLFGGVLALVGVLLRFELPESARWLIARGRLEEAERVVAGMETRARRHADLTPVTTPAEVPPVAEAGAYGSILGHKRYLWRTLVLFLMWFVSYITVYGFAAGFTTVLAAAGYPPPEAGLITAIGTAGFVLCALVAYAWGDHIERKGWLPIAALLTVIGAFITGIAGNVMWASVLGAVVIFFGFNVWVPIAYAWTTENFPTRARTTGFALVDGLGHLGGGVGLLFIAPLIPQLGVLKGLLVISAFLVLGAVIAQFGIRARGLPLDELSP